MQFFVGIHMDENVYMYCIYMSSIVCHMQLQVNYNLSYAIVPNAVACGVCNWNLVATISYKIGIFF
jgi:hypothetical protein